LRDRMHAKLQPIKAELHRKMHETLGAEAAG
jgi:hypothetical protein